MKPIIITLLTVGSVLAQAPTFPVASPSTSGGTCAGLSGDVTGTCGANTLNASGVTIPNGSTATTQATGDASNDVSTNAFLANALASINPAVSVQAATVAVLSNTPTYSNGTAGVGATLTAGSNGALTVDGYTVLLNDRILVKNQASTLQNGVYTLTTLGTGGVPYVLTRATDYNTVSNINYTGTVPVLQGSTLASTGWNLTNQITAVGTSGLTYNQSSTGTGGVPSNGNVKASGNLANGDVIEGAGGKTLVDTGVAFSKMTQTIASGSTAMATSAIASGACDTSKTGISATGVATTDNIMADFNADPTGTTGYQPSASGMLTIIKYPTSNNVNFKVCNNTGSSITPGAVTLNWRVVR